MAGSAVVASGPQLWPSSRVNRPVSANTCVWFGSQSRTHSLGHRCESGSLRVGFCGFLWQRGLGLRVSASGDGEASGVRSEEGSPSRSLVQLVAVPRTSADVVQEFYDLINRRDVLGVANLFTEDCVYDDFNFPEPKKGREEILKFFEKVMSSFGSDLKFVIDDITKDDPNAVGVIWHLDWRGKAFPFSKGCSFYRCEMNSSGQRQIKYARDIVEPTTRPGDMAMALLKFVTSLFERFPQLIDRL